MNRQIGLAGAAIAALCGVALTASSASATIEELEICLGTFKNRPLHPGQMLYSGDYESFFTPSQIPGTNDTIINVDLAALFTLNPDYNAISSISLADGGGNGYGEHSPGADIDLFRINSINGPLGPEFSYIGGNDTHVGESSAILAQRVAEIDGDPNIHDHEGLLHASLGENGVLTAFLDEPAYASDMLDIDIVETGSTEWMTLCVTMTYVEVPAPGALACLGLGVFARRRRRDA